MNNKLLVNVFVPLLEEKYELYIPINKRISVVIKLIEKALKEMTNGYYPIKEGSVIIDVETGNVYDVNITVKEAAIIRSGSKETISPENASFACAIKTVNIRADVNTKSQKVGELKKGEKVEVIKAFYTKDFHQILYKGKTCYVAVKFVELK